MIYLSIKQKIAAVFGIVAVIISFCACSIDDVFQNSGNSSYSAQTTEPSSAVPPKKLNNYAYSYNSIESRKVKELYMLINEKARLLLSAAFKIEGEITDFQMGEALEAYRNDHPEVFWLTSEISYFYKDGNTFINLSYNIAGEELIKAKKSFNSTVEKIIDDAPRNSSDYEKELYVNNYLVENCSYDDKATETENVVKNENDAYGALIDKTAVCEGYARAFQLLCNKLGIECVTISGIADNENHAWNCAKIDGDWYQVDTTWNDTDGKDTITENDYFNLTDEQMYTDHTASVLYKDCTEEEYDSSVYWCNNFVPECTATRYNYYRQNYVTISDLSGSSELFESIAESALNNEDYCSFVIDNSLDYKCTVYELINNGYLAEWIDKANDLNGDSPMLSNTCYVYKKEKLRVVTFAMTYI